MDIFHEIELEECPVCGGAGIVEEENGWCMYVSCLDCGSRTAELPYNTPEEREPTARRAASLWNMGKVIHTGVGD